jgi:hypothetical protein
MLRLISIRIRQPSDRVQEHQERIPISPLKNQYGKRLLQNTVSLFLLFCLMSRGVDKSASDDEIKKAYRKKGNPTV